MGVTRLRLKVGAAAVSALTAGAGLTVMAGGASAAQPAMAASAPHASVRHVVPSGSGAVIRSARRGGARFAGAVRTATSTVTDWVSNSAPVGGNTGCSDPGYATISAALAAAPAGATIEVCAGLYPEQLAITQPVRLNAIGSVIVQLPASPADNLTACDADGGAQPNQDVVDICGPVSVAIDGFTVQGTWPSNVCNDSLYGVAVLGGAKLDLSNSTVMGIGGNPQTDGCQGGIGIEVGLATSGTTADPGTATLTNDVVSAYQKNGITVDGTGSNATISKVTVFGTGPTPGIAQNGIQVSDGARASITGSMVTGDECNDTAGGCGPNGFSNAQSVGILLFDAGKTTVSGTAVTTSDIGVYNIEDYAWAYYTPPSPFSPVLETFSGMKLANRYENAYFDEGRSSLTSSKLTGGEVGVASAQWSGQATPAVSNTSGVTVTGASQYAVQLYSDGTGGDLPVKMAVTHSRFQPANKGGVGNESSSVIAAEHNWWGAATGPSDWSFGTGTSVSSDVNFFPWAKTAALSTFATCSAGLSLATTGNDVVLCAKAGTGTAELANKGAGDALLIGNSGSDQLTGSAVGGETWIIGGNPGANVINGNGGTGFIQERGNTSDTLSNTASYTVAP